MSHTMASSTQTKPKLDKYGYNAIARHLFMGVMIGVLIFLGAGTVEWGWGWIAAISTFAGWLFMSLVLMSVNPELLNQRGKRGKDLVGTKQWDWILLTLYGILTLVLPFVGGLDFRYGWMLHDSVALMLLGNLLILGGFALLTWAMSVNRNFEATVRIQEQRGHHVISSGPYQYVRHPGYSGVLLSTIGTALALGGIAVWLPVLATVIVFVIRTYLEDTTLQRELPGYSDFAEQTRYRLLLGIW